MTPRALPVILAITNRVELAEAIGRATRIAFTDLCEFTGITYSMCPAHLTPRAIEEADLFVIELLRSYPGGLRAEGVALGRRLAAKRKRVLIVSPLSLASRLSCQCYWDVAADESVSGRITRLFLESTEWVSELERLEAMFLSLLAIPPQHGE
jgi:hypothetical protein